ncbi:MAG: hypothetical protein KAY32_08810 [Candidatus Eisenbacteria sp.]|nr:hypothetical protein [Candidatus Eisenbacteria bacterium]
MATDSHRAAAARRAAPHGEAGIAVLLRHGRRARLRRQSIEILLGWVGLCLPGLALLFLAGLAVPPERHWSGIMAGLALVWIVGTLLWVARGALWRRLSLAAYAQWLQRLAGLRRNELTNALALERDRARWADDPISRDLVELAIVRARERFRRLSLRALHARRSLRGPLLRAAAAGLPLLLVALLAPARFADTARLFLAAGGVGVVPPVTLEVSPGAERVEWGASVEIEATIAGRRRPDGAAIEMRRPDGDWTAVPMVRVPRGDDRDRYSFLISSLKGDLDYRIEARWASSPVYHLRVVHRLQATGYRKRYEPPAYTGLAPQREVSSAGDLAGLVGTIVTLEVLHRRPEIAGRILFDAGGDPLPLRPVADDRLGAKWALTTSGSYRVELRDPREDERWLSDVFTIEAVPDLAPLVRLLSPPPVIDMPPEMQVPLEVDCVDDFGVTEVALIYGRPGDDPTREVLRRWMPANAAAAGATGRAAPMSAPADVEAPGGAESGSGGVEGPFGGVPAEARIVHVWNLESLPLLPGQELHYFLQVLDNDPLHGPKSAETPLATIRFPTMAEMYVQAEDQRENEIESMAETLADQEGLRESLQRISREMLREDEISWERQQELGDLLQRQEELGRKIEQLEQSLEASAQRMENQSLFSMEVLEKVRQIQELVQQVHSEDFRQAVERMQQALQDLDQRELQRAMEQMKVTQQEVSQALDRTLQMLRRLLAEEQLDRILQQLDELTTRQAAINEQLAQQAAGETPETPPVPERAGETPPGEQQAAADSAGAPSEPQPLSEAEAEALEKEQERLERELAELQEMLEKLEKGDAAVLDDLRQALEEMREQGEAEQALEEMRRAREAMAQNDRESSLRFGRRAQKRLEQMQSGLSAMRQEIDQERLEYLVRALFGLANRMVDVSLRQETLVARGRSQGPHELAVRQQELYEETQALTDSLQALSREVPLIGMPQMRAMGEALKNLGAARDAFETGQRGRAVSLAEESVRAVNAAVRTLLESAAQAQSSCQSSCPNPFNRMQCLTGQQSSLNQETRQMMGACQTPRLTQSQQQGMMRLAARQEMIRQGLDEIQGSMQGSQQMLGDLQSVVEEMEEVAEQLRQRNADPRIIERQERILSRLLTAQRSIRQRDRSEQRESRTARDRGPRAGPPPVDEGESLAERLQRAMLRGSQDPVPAEYRPLVEQYLRSLLRRPAGRR